MHMVQLNNNVALACHNKYAHLTVKYLILITGYCNTCNRISDTHIISCTQ